MFQNDKTVVTMKYVKIKCLKMMVIISTTVLSLYFVGLKYLRYYVGITQISIYQLIVILCFDATFVFSSLTIFI